MERYYTIGEYLVRKLRPGLDLETGEKLKDAAVKLSAKRDVEIKWLKGRVRHRLVAPKFEEAVLIDVFEEFEI